jgi:hypothetical protein
MHHPVDLDIFLESMIMMKLSTDLFHIDQILYVP